MGELLNRVKSQNKITGKKITYVGRLDPLASGLCLFLVGDEVYRKDKFLKLDKQYKASILLGFRTDSFDVLGLPKPAPKINSPKEKLLDFIGRTPVKFPPFSSRRVAGKPLWQWTKEGIDKTNDAPRTNLHITAIADIAFQTTVGNDLLRDVTKKISIVHGDFRQIEILQSWQGYINPFASYQLLNCTLDVKSGSYIRTLADMLNGCLFSLHRTRIGEYHLNDIA